MPINDAIQDTIHAGFTDPQPGQIVEEPIGDLLHCANGEDHTEWQPKQHEQYKTVQIGEHEGVVPTECDWWLEVGTCFCCFDLVGGTDVADEGETERHEDEDYADGGLVRNEAGALAGAVVEGEVGRELKTWGRNRLVTSTTVSQIRREGL